MQEDTNNTAYATFQASQSSQALHTIDITIPNSIMHLHHYIMNLFLEEIHPPNENEEKPLNTETKKETEQDNVKEICTEEIHTENKEMHKGNEKYNAKKEIMMQRKIKEEVQDFTEIVHGLHLWLCFHRPKFEDERFESKVQTQLLQELEVANLYVKTLLKKLSLQGSKLSDLEKKAQKHPTIQDYTFAIDFQQDMQLRTCKRYLIGLRDILTSIYDMFSKNREYLPCINNTNNNK